MEIESNTPLFETTKGKRRILYKIFAATEFASICLIWIYRLTHMPMPIEEGEYGLWVWFGLLASEIWFGFYWFLTQAPRWNLVYRLTHKDRLSVRYKNDLPGVDIFVCTADHVIEPPIMVVSTVLSAMAYDYPPEKLSVYLSDDGGSDITYYALLEASNFAKHWIPYCKRFNVEPRSPAAYFALTSSPVDNGSVLAKNFVAVKKLYEEMKDRIENATKLGRIPEEVKLMNKGFSEWTSYSSKRDHGTILKILTERNDQLVKDIDGCPLPSLVYLAREKRPQYHHHFKAGALNALLRVSSKISNGEIILTLDCDMYSNNSLAVRDALCFFMDEERSKDIAFVQFPQNFKNVTKNDLYGNSLLVISNVEFHGLDGHGGPMYIGTGCFHRRDTLCGRKYTSNSKFDWERCNGHKKQKSIHELEQEAMPLANCSYEENTQWGNEIGLRYGFPVEDIITGLSIQCRGWRSVYFNPERKAFLGVAPTSLPQVLVQHKRWSEGDFQIMLSKFSPVWYGHGQISYGLQMGYLTYFSWPLNSLPILYYSIVPSLYFLKGTSLFPQVSSLWFLPYAYALVAPNIYSIVEFLHSGGTILGWWNEQRIWLYKRSSSYLFALIDTILKSFGFSESGFTITSKVADDDTSKRYEKEIMEFGATSSMLSLLATLAMTNLFCFIGVVSKKLVIDNESVLMVYETMPLQTLLCFVYVAINLPLYQGLFLRIDKGRIPISITIKSIVFALLLCSSFAFLY